MTNNWNEAEHPRDDIGRFTYKNGGGNASGIVLKGEVKKYDYTDNRGDSSSKGGGIGETIGAILGGVFGVLLTPETIQAVLTVLAAKYTISEMKKIKEELYDYMEKHSNSEQSSQELQNAKLEKLKQELFAKQQESDRKLQNRLDILYPTMKNEKQNDNKSNFSDSLSNLANQPKQYPYNLTQNSLLAQLAVDHVNNPILKKAATELFGLETAENLLMSKKDSYLNTDYAKEHLIFKNYKELSTDLRNYFEKKIIKQIGADKLETTGGIYINAQHYSSKELAKVLADNKEFVKKVAEARKSMEVGNSVKTSIQFTDRNFHYAIGKADILDMHINKNGEIDLLVTDVYDFNKDKNASTLVKTGRNRQEKGEIKPYFYIYHVIIPKSAKLGESGRK